MEIGGFPSPSARIPALGCIADLAVPDEAVQRSGDRTQNYVPTVDQAAAGKDFVPVVSKSRVEGADLHKQSKQGN